MRTTFAAAVSVFLALAASPSPSRAQCHTWNPTFGANSTNGFVFALTVFDDGQGAKLYAGGDFTNAGGIAVGHLARWDGTSWSPAPGSTNGIVDALAALDVGNGPELYAAGHFTGIDFVSGTEHVARWTGSSWASMGGGITSANAVVYALAAFDDGMGPAIFAGGLFTEAGGTSVRNIARWDGSQWSGIDGLDSAAFALTLFDDGQGAALYAGGAFVRAGGNLAAHVAKWNGTSWSALGPGLVSTGNSQQVYSLAVFDDGSGPALYAGGFFTLAGSLIVNHIARWNGTSWSALGSGTNDAVLALSVFDDGSGPALYAGGYFTTAGGAPASRIARWNGSSWSSLGSGMNQAVQALVVYDDGSGADLFAGGQFTTAGGAPSQCIAEWIDCPGAIAPFCGTQTGAGACPCNNGGVPSYGCNNSSNTGGALLTASGATSPDSIVLTSGMELPSALSIFLQGSTALSPGVAFGDGLRCVGGTLLRLYVKNASGGLVHAPDAGDPSITARSAALGDPIPSGASRYYQVYYRDPSLTFCPAPQGDTWNVSSGVSIVWN